MTAARGRDLFEAVVACTGLASFIGPGAVERALESVGAGPDVATVEDYRKALPQLKTRMAVYLKEGELQAHLTALERLIRA